MSLCGEMGGGATGGKSAFGGFGVDARIGVGAHPVEGFEKACLGCGGVVGALV